MQVADLRLAIRSPVAQDFGNVCERSQRQSDVMFSLIDDMDGVTTRFSLNSHRVPYFFISAKTIIYRHIVTTISLPISDYASTAQSLIINHFQNSH